MKLLHVQEDFAVCVKPVGMDAEHALPDALKQELGGEIYPLHRLDLNVGGVMVYARTKACAATLSRCIQEGQMIKEYVALVHGAPPAEGVLEDYLYKDPRKNKVFAVKRLRKGVKEAKLSYHLLRTEGEKSLVHIRLYTGRSHQIRVQFSSRGYPLVGDHKYGSRDTAVNPFLFSCRVTFPYKGKDVSFSALPPWAE